MRLHNRTSETQTFLWWANVAARVHDDYQSFFPTDVAYVADHARRAITAFPEADRPYYGFDYTRRHETGGDRIDFYRNIPVPTSYMVTGTRDGFFGGYDHAAGAGFVHVADRHIAPGKKQWTWGNAPSGTPGIASSPTPTAPTSNSWPVSTPTTSPTSPGSNPARPRPSTRPGSRIRASTWRTRPTRRPPSTST